MNLKPIRNEADYESALERAHSIFDAPTGSPESEELQVLAVLIEFYEDRKFPIDPSNPVDAIKFRMDQLNMKPVDLAKIIGYKSRVSEILNGKRKLSLTMIRQLHKHLHIPIDVLIMEY